MLGVSGSAGRRGGAPCAEDSSWTALGRTIVLALRHHLELADAARALVRGECLAHVALWQLAERGEVEEAGGVHGPQQERLRGAVSVPARATRATLRTF